MNNVPSPPDLKVLLRDWAVQPERSNAAAKLARAISDATGVPFARASEWIGALQLAVCHPDLCSELFAREER